jgi:ribose transport system ATP-binding protein
MNNQVVLTLKNITKDFPGVRALDKVNFELFGGEVRGLVGANGAGKSTLIKISSGVYEPNEGEILLDGQPVRFTHPSQAIHSGISVIYQESEVIPHLNVIENIFLGREMKGRSKVFVDFRRQRQRAKKILDQLNIDLDLDALVGALSVSHQQMVSIARALELFDSQIFIMDEPTSALSKSEVEKLFNVIHLLRNQGRSVVFISHRLEEIFTICDSVTVLRDGKCVGNAKVKDIDEHYLVTRMVGEGLKNHYFEKKKSSRSIGEEILQVEGLRRDGVLKNISFSLRKGEVLGITGLVGAGKTELLKAIFGADSIDGGKIYIKGKQVQINSPLDAVNLGMGLVPENRNLEGLVMGHRINENISVTSPDKIKISRLGFISESLEMRKIVGHQGIKKLDIKIPHFKAKVESLSGGNRQKVVLAKWLFREAEILLFDEPTRGIDVRVKAEIRDLIRKLGEEGTAVIVSSCEFSEILTVSDRIIVMHDGKITGELLSDEVSEDKMMRLATGGTS